jgi:hypothetical protein
MCSSHGLVSVVLDLCWIDGWGCPSLGGLEDRDGRRARPMVSACAQHAPMRMNGSKATARLRKKSSRQTCCRACCPTTQFGHASASGAWAIAATKARDVSRTRRMTRDCNHPARPRAAALSLARHTEGRWKAVMRADRRCNMHARRRVGCASTAVRNTGGPGWSTPPEPPAF